MADLVVVGLTPTGAGDRASMLLTTASLAIDRNIFCTCLCASNAEAGHVAVHHLVDDFHCDVLVTFGVAWESVSCDEDDEDEPSLTVERGQYVYPNHHVPVLTLAVPDAEDEWWRVDANQDRFITELSEAAELRIRAAEEASKQWK